MVSPGAQASTSSLRMTRNASSSLEKQDPRWCGARTGSGKMSELAPVVVQKRLLGLPCRLPVSGLRLVDFVGARETAC